VAPHSTDPSALSRISLFRGVPARDLQQLATRMHERSFPAGTSVLTAEEPGEAVYVLVRGTVKVHTSLPDGSEVILAVLGAGEVVGKMSLADSLGRSASVTTLEDSTFLWMDRNTFLSGIEEVPAIARNLLGILSRRLRLPDTHARAALDVHSRIAAQLLAFARRAR
jgi:CRP/FNR family transcriptional regulator, cyclic AMP receptor protein